ncbi:MAG: putative 2OG-Fe(II) oxygenase [SAR86 cluster bacterium]|jgi:hypothetical protein|nr:putative 2OG-Fe(II) oxygenase [SAR86 cluster bacterium]|tara:strand:+ start:22212 stop:22880 length:669 start_codon:yes stop_codon:yes gene_type:complete
MSQYKYLSIPAIFILEAEMPQEMLDEINSYLDKAINSDLSLTNADRLIGQGETIEQLRLDPKEKAFGAFSEIVLTLGVEYIKRYSENTKEYFRKTKKLEIDSLWSVHSYAGDYNPLHDHLTKTTMGISFTGWTKIPEQIGSHGIDMYNASGASDGFINFTWGSTSLTDKERLRPKNNILLEPKEGKLLFFPSWVQHTVYPFRGEGERRTIAGNINCWDVEDK